jgi:hypothetical protein
MRKVRRVKPNWYTVQKEKIIEEKPERALAWISKNSIVVPIKLPKEHV